MILLALAVAWTAGVSLVVRFDVREPALGLFLLASALLVALSVGLRRPVLPALLVALLVLGMIRVEALDDDRPSRLSVYHGRPVQLQGVIADDPEAAGAFTRFKLHTEKVEADDATEEVSGVVLVTARESTGLVRERDRPYFRYGDRLLLEGKLEAPPELDDFDYPLYLARQGIDTVMSFPTVELLDDGQGAAFYNWLYGVRRDLADSLARVVPEPQASLGQAVLLGIRDGLPDGLVDDFRATGTSHILAISGLHVGILMALSLAAGRWLFGRRYQLYLVLPFTLMWLYALISGMSPSVARAAIMGSVYLAALLVGRPRSVLPGLGLAAAVMVAVSPGVAWSVSFQLSFAAIAGIAVLAEPLSAWLLSAYIGRFGSDGGVPSFARAMSDIIAMTIAATVATLPLIAFYFERVSLVGVPTTLLVLPALPLVLVGQAVAGVAGLLSTGLGEVFGWVAWLWTRYVTGVVGLMARLPAASVETGPLAPVLVWAYYGVIALLLLRGRAWRLLRGLGFLQRDPDVPAG